MHNRELMPDLVRIKIF